MSGVALAVLLQFMSLGAGAPLAKDKLTCHAVDQSGHSVYRSMTRRDMFRRMTGYPHGRKGYVVDHIVALECGGCDVPSNMQWQTIADAKRKDRTEGKCAE